MLSPQGRVIMVSGANRGIGLAVARCLHGKGYGLSLGGRDTEALEAAVADLGAERLMTHRYDALDRASSEAWVAATVARFGRIDGLVNNAGIVLHLTVEDDDEEAFDRLWAVNVKGPLRMIRLALPYLKESGEGRIVNLASASAKRVPNTNAGYAMSKFAVVALTHATRQLVWNDGVRVTAVCPGYVATDMTAGVATIAHQEMIPPGDLAELVATVIALPNNAAVAELVVNCRLESTL
ncbi:MAG: SDR family NAD(P)-dependent oxidoreductase [Proteobacteria bacterium]|nr:SDR family NAD(P)-dependent oxidoreductase [Pseudomonadota bacterium]